MASETRSETSETEEVQPPRIVLRTQEELAAALGVKRYEVGEFLARGMPGRRGEYDFGVCANWYLHHMRLDDIDSCDRSRAIRLSLAVLGCDEEVRNALSILDEIPAKQREGWRFDALKGSLKKAINFSDRLLGFTDQKPRWSDLEPKGDRETENDD